MKNFFALITFFSGILIFFLRFLLNKQTVAKATLVQDKNPHQDLSPRLQNLKTEKWHLKNGLSLFLVSDPDVSQCGIGLLAQVGSADDPSDAMGTAHFIEHMLAGRANADFDDGLNEFVLGQGGTYNALTSIGYTFYGISLSNELFESTSHRLFAMLQNPLFLEDETKAELSAVDEEFYICSMHDGLRIWSGLLSQLNKECTIQRYHPGNRLTLGHKTGASFKKWFEYHYTSYNGTCVAISSQSINEIRKIVLPLANKVPIRKKWERPHQHYEQNQSRFIFIETLQGTNCLLFVWPFLAEPLPEKQQDLYLLTHLINSDHSGGLSATLKEEGLAEECEGSIEILGNHLPALFCIEVKLTDQGVSNWETVYSFIETFLDQATQLKASYAEKMIKELYLAQLLEYQYRGKSQPFDFISRMAVALIKEQLDTFPFHGIAPNSFNYSSYKEAVKRLLHSHKIVLLGSVYSKWADAQDNLPGKPKTYDALSEMPSWGYKHYATNCPSVQKKEISFSFPGMQRFLPESVPQPYSIQETSTLTVSPQMYSGPHFGPIFLVQDVYFGIPKDYLLIRLKHPRFFNKDPRWHLLSESWGRILNKALDELEYLAGTSGNYIAFGHKEPYAVRLSLISWERVSEKLLKEMLNQLKLAPLNKKNLDRILEEITLEIQAIEASPPFQTAGRIFEENIQDIIPTLEERKAFVQNVTLEEIENFAKSFLQEASFETVYLGQRNKEQLSPLLNLCENFFPTNYSSEMGKDPFSSGLELGMKTVRFNSLLPGHAARLSIDCGSSLSTNNYVCAWVLSSGLDPIAMNQLREKEELAYVVRCGLQEANGRFFLTILTQSTKVSSDFLTQRYRLLLDDLLEKIGEEPFFHKEKFEALRVSFIEHLQAPAISATNFLNKILHLTFDKKQNWIFDTEAIKAAEELTFLDFKMFCNDVLNIKNVRQLLIAVEGSLQEKK